MTSLLSTSGDVAGVEVPRFHEFLAPALTVLCDGEQRAAREVIGAVADLLDLDQAQRSLTIPSGQRRLDNRVLWALSYLSQARAVVRHRRGV